MCAKPIIDIDVVIDNIKSFKNIKNDLELIGYIHEGNLGITGREAFKRDNSHNDLILDNTIIIYMYV